MAHVSSMPMTFKGIPADAFDFFDELAADNTKTWWTDNKDRYEANVRGPIDSLLTELAEEFGPGKIFRPYRDVRFSKDKTPYKTNLGATTQADDGSVYYVALDTHGLYLGSGKYQMEKEQIDRFRLAVADDATGAQFARLVAALEKKGFEAGAEHLKRVPKGYEPDHPRARFLKHKGFYMGRQIEPAAWMGTKKAKDRIAATWRELRPLNDWLNQHVG